MKLSDLYNKELREKLLKEDLDYFLEKYSNFMDKQIEDIKKSKIEKEKEIDKKQVIGEIIKLSVSLHIMYSYLKEACLNEDFDKGLLLSMGANMIEAHHDGIVDVFDFL